MDRAPSCDLALDDPLAVADLPPDPDHHASATPDGADHDGSRFDGLDGQALQRALATQPVIEQAKGMLMGYYGIDADHAFALLSRWSSDRHMKVRDLCAGLVRAAAVPHPEPFGALRGLLDDHPTR